MIPRGFGERLIHQKNNSPTVVSADWLKAGPMVSKLTVYSLVIMQLKKLT